MPSHNKPLRQQIKDLYCERQGLSYESQKYKRITKDIEILALQIESEHHWSATPSFWVAVMAMVAACIAAYPVVVSFLSNAH